MYKYDLDGSSYILDLFCPISVVPEIVGLSIAIYAWKYTDATTDILKSIFHIFSIFLLLQFFSIALLSAKIGMTLNGYRDYNNYHYFGSVIALIIAILPWFHKYLAKSETIKKE